MKPQKRETCLIRVRIGIGPLGPACRLPLIPLSLVLRILLPLRRAAIATPILTPNKRVSIPFFLSNPPNPSTPNVVDFKLTLSALSTPTGLPTSGLLCGHVAF